ncbi:MAG: SEC-C domain-containing protein [Anaerolineae bacterium]|nr:SEC-C domain-containing protein [Anaerolineae bacterium]
MVPSLSSRSPISRVEEPCMPEVGRNDPCPCGSGKKYKNCCLRKDRMARSRQLGLNPGEGFMTNALYEFAQTPRFGGELVQAFEFFWGGVYDLEVLPQVAPEDVQRTLEWFVHDYPIGSERRHIIDLYIESQGDRYVSEAREILEAWAQSTMGLFRVLELTGAEQLRVYDPLREQDLEIVDRSLAHNARAGDVLVGRLFELDGVRRLSLMTLVLPEEFEAPMGGYVRNARRLYEDEHPGTSGWDTFLRENGHLFNAFLLSPQVENLRSLIGPGTRFHDPADTRDQMRDFTLRRRRERQREMAEAEQEIPQTHRTASGLILPGSAPEREAPGQEEPEESPRPRILIPGRDL